MPEKTLYTMRSADGRLLRYAGASWQTVGTFAPASWPTTTKYLKSYACFVLNGKLHTRYRQEDHVVRIDVFDGSDMSHVSNMDLALQVAEKWGPVILYKGRVYWLAIAMENTDRHYLSLYTFYYEADGTPHFNRRRMDEVGYTTIDQFVPTSTTSQNFAGLILNDYRDRLVITPGGGVQSQDSYHHLPDLSMAIDFDQYDNAFATAIDDGVPSKRWDEVSRDGTLTHAQLTARTMAACSWRGKLYALAPNGKVYEFDPITNTRTAVIDLHTLSGMMVDGGAAIVTTAAGNSTHQLKWNDFATSMYPGLVGARLTIANYNGTGQPKVCYVTHNSYDSGWRVSLIGEDGSTVSAQPSGRSITTSWGFFSYADNTTPQRFMNMFVFNNKLHILLCPSRVIDNGEWALNTARVPPWSLTVWDGSNAPTNTTYRNGADVFACTGFAMTVDRDASMLHILYSDPIALNMQHVKIDLSSYALTNVGTVCTRSSDSYEAIAGQVLDAIVPFDDQDVTPLITGYTPDSSQGQITVNYKLFSTNSANTASVAVQFNVGSGWADATRKSGETKTGLSTSSTGASHSFVHDVVEDLTANFSGTLQYRIEVLTQTRQ